MHSKDHKHAGAQSSNVEHLIASRKRLSRIRCILECIQCLKERKKLPECICYVPSEVEYKFHNRTTIKVYPEPVKNNKKLKELHCTPESRIIASGEEFCNAHGKWLRLKKVCVKLYTHI